MGGRAKLSPEEYYKRVEKINPGLKFLTPFTTTTEKVTVVDEYGMVYTRVARTLYLYELIPFTLENRRDRFLANARKIHGDKYDYSEVEYINARTEVKIICPEHGEFWQVPDCHVGKSHGYHGCPKCGRDKSDISRAKQDSPFWKLDKWKKSALKAKHFSGFKFYIIRCYNDKENFFKIGRTYRRIFDRFESKYVMPYDWELLLEYEGTAEEIFDLESSLKEKIISSQYRPEIDIFGVTECFSINQQTNLEIYKIINKYE